VTDIRRGDGTLVKTIAVADIAGLRDLGWSAPEAFVVKADDGVTDLHGILWKPAMFDPSRKYPIIEYIYGGAQSVVPSGFSGWNPGVWMQAMAQLGFITIHLESRGTAGRGRQFAAWKFGNVGRYEIPDHVAALRQLAASRPYMDRTRVGIYGYSWGGHFAMRAMLQAPDVYHVGVAGEADTDLRGSDGVGEPEHRGGLDYGSNFWLADRLQGKLLIFDGNPRSATMRMINEFVRHDKRIDFMLFPGIGHEELTEPRLYDGYVWRMVRDYFVEHLKP
jgi:dipeptidyl aminopeptidase/acylaminoacyl peptidase